MRAGEKTAGCSGGSWDCGLEDGAWIPGDCCGAAGESCACSGACTGNKCGRAGGNGGHEDRQRPYSADGDLWAGFRGNEYPLVRQFGWSDLLAAAGPSEMTSTAQPPPTAIGTMTCNPEVVLAPTCCISVYCGMLPLWGGGNVHCWLEVQNCDLTTDRFEVWQSEAEIEEQVAAHNLPPTTRLGEHVVQNLRQPGIGVGMGQGKLQCGPVCVACTKSSPFLPEIWGGDWCPPVGTWTGCECVKEAAVGYDRAHFQEYFAVFGANSNTFAQVVIDECGLHCDLPPSAVGADHSYGPSVVARGCTVRVQAGMGTGITVGLTQLTAEIGGLPVGVSEEGIHCLVTITWPWRWF